MSETEETSAGDLLPFSADSPLMPGTPVVDVDGEALGTVGEDAGDRFKVAAPMAPDYWLPKDAIAGIAPGGDLVIRVEADDLDEIKLEGEG
jgi:hypothetical protein